MPKLIKKYNLKTPSWESLLDNLNYSMYEGNSPHGIKHNPLGFFVTHEADKISEVKEVLEKLDLNYAHLYLNLLINEETFGRHNDEVDVYFWQVQGISKWIFDKENYILEKGDLIIVPKGIYHDVKPLSPRAGISMSK
tara:strand:+ start:216 stop:629 length:414 start_codon:yes stop_codon:yes gene_type:complete